MNPLDTEFHRRLSRKLGEELNDRTTKIVSGVLDHLDYKRESGYIRALKETIEWCAEIESDMNQGK